MSKIFISYRRDDSSGYTIPLFDRLVERFGYDSVFKDIDTIDYGEDFSDEIERAVIGCDILIAVIGRDWLDARDTEGRRRLDNPEDFVRIEIQTALDQGIRVIPTLVGGATMPESDVLPQSLSELARRQSIELRDTHFHSDLDRLLTTVDNILFPEKVVVKLLKSTAHSRDLEVSLAGEMHYIKLKWLVNSLTTSNIAPTRILVDDNEFKFVTDRDYEFKILTARKSYSAKINYDVSEGFWNQSIIEFQLEIDGDIVYKEG